MSMRRLKWLQAGCAAVMLTLSVSVTALAVPQLVTAQTSAGRDDAYWSWPEEWRYTQADLELVRDCGAAGYEDLTLAEFDRRAADWDDEVSFHRMEDALGRLRRSYPESGEYYGFIHGTLLASFRECSAKHYGGKCDRVTPYYADEAVRTRTADVFGDAYTVFEAEAGYILNYRVEDEEKTRVADRDKLLTDYRAAVQAFLDGKTEQQLLDEKTMEKALEAELKRLNKVVAVQGITLTGTGMDYYWVDGYEDNGLG